jgi:hypothetical protein
MIGPTDPQADDVEVLAHGYPEMHLKPSCFTVPYTVLHIKLFDLQPGTMRKSLQATHRKVMGLLVALPRTLFTSAAIAPHQTPVWSNRRTQLP